MSNLPRVSTAPWLNRVGFKGIDANGRIIIADEPWKCTFQEFKAKKDEFMIITQDASEAYDLAIQYYKDFEVLK